MRQKIGWAVQSLAFSGCDSLPEVFGVPLNYDGGEKVKACHAEVLALGSAIADFTLSTDTQGVFQGVMRYAFVQTDLGTALHVGIKHPFDDEQRPFHPSDFLEGLSQLMLAEVGREFAEQLAGRHDACDHGGGAAQDVWPVGGDDALADFAADQALQFLWALPGSKT